MTVMVRNEKNKIEQFYQNVEDVVFGNDRFILFLEDDNTATFHYEDADGSEWDAYLISNK